MEKADIYFHQVVRRLHHSGAVLPSALFVRGGQRWQIEKLMSMEMKLFLRDSVPVSEPYDGRNQIALLNMENVPMWVDESWNIDPKFN